MTDIIIAGDIKEIKIIPSKGQRQPVSVSFRSFNVVQVLMLCGLLWGGWSQSIHVLADGEEWSSADQRRALPRSSESSTEALRRLVLRKNTPQKPRKPATPDAATSVASPPVPRFPQPSTPLTAMRNSSFKAVATPTHQGPGPSRVLLRRHHHSMQPASHRGSPGSPRSGTGVGDGSLPSLPKPQALKPKQRFSSPDTAPSMVLNTPLPDRRKPNISPARSRPSPFVAEASMIRPALSPSTIQPTPPQQQLQQQKQISPPTPPHWRFFPLEEEEGGGGGGGGRATNGSIRYSPMNLSAELK